MSDYEPYVPEKSDEQARDEQNEQARLASSIGVVDDVIQWLDNCIEAYRGIDQIEGLNPSTNPEAFLRAGLLNQGMHQEFVRKRDEFRDTFREYLEKKGDDS